MCVCFCQHCEGFSLIHHDIQDSFLPRLSLTRLFLLNALAWYTARFLNVGKKKLDFNSFCQGSYSQKLDWNSNGGISPFYFMFTFFLIPYLADPLLCRGPDHPWSTGRCRCSWKPRRTEPPVLPARLTGRQAPERSAHTTLRKKHRDGEINFRLLPLRPDPDHLLLLCIELQSLSLLLLTHACPYGGCWGNIVYTFIEYMVIL